MKKLNTILAVSALAFAAFMPLSAETTAADGLNPQFTAQWTRGADGVIRTAVPASPRERVFLCGKTALRARGNKNFS